MPRSQMAEPVEFIRLNGHAVRVTSWKELEPAGGFGLVAIVRGSGDANTLAAILESPEVELELPGQPPQNVAIRALERRDTGSAPGTISRFVADLVPLGEQDRDKPSPLTLEERIATLERQVARLQAHISAMSENESIPRFDQPL